MLRLNLILTLYQIGIISLNTLYVKVKSDTAMKYLYCLNTLYVKVK